MAEIIDHIKGRIVEYDERRGELIIRAPYSDFATMVRREYKDVDIQLIDSRPLSSKQRRSCYAMIREISDWNGDLPEENKHYLKINFWCTELLQTADTLFSLSNAPMSVVAAFQSYLVRFIVRNDVPTNRPMLDYVDDVGDYIFACLINKKCLVCGKHADLHHVQAIGAGRNRDTIDHLGMEVLPLCREHHNEIHTMGKSEFFSKYHIQKGITVDKTIAKIYKLNISKEKKND